MNNTTGERWTEVTNENGVAVFGDDADERLLVYDVRNDGTACDYTISEVNVDSRYNVPKAQNVSLANGTVDLTVTAAFVNELKTGGLKINKQSEDGAEPALVRCRLIRFAQAAAEVFLLPLARSA